MAFSPLYPIFGGETKDIATEAITSIAATDCTIQTSRVQTGSSGIEFPMDANAKNCLLPASDNRTFVSMGINGGGIVVVIGANGVSAQPNSGQICLMCGDTGAGTARRYLRIGNAGATDRKLRIYDKSGTQIGPASTSEFPTSGVLPWAVSFDSLNPAGGLVFVKVYFYNGGAWAEEFSFHSGLAWSSLFDVNFALLFGENLAGGVNRGAKLYGDDMTLRTSTAAAAALHRTPFPWLKQYGGAAFAATKEGNSAAWPSGTTPSPNTWQDIAATHDFPNDGGTSIIATVLASAKHLFRWGDGTSGFGNPLPNPLTIDNVYLAMVHRASGAGKNTNDGLLRLNGSESTLTLRQAPGSSDVGNIAPGTYDAARPGGGSFARGDFDLRAADNYSEMEFGGVTLGSGAGVNLTEFPGPVVAGHEATLPLGSSPSGIVYVRRPIMQLLATR